MAAYGESGLTPLLPMTEEGIPCLMSITGSPDTIELALFSRPNRLFPTLEATSPPSSRGKVWLRLFLNSSMCPWLTGLDSATFQDAAVVNKLKEHDINKLRLLLPWMAIWWAMVYSWDPPLFLPLYLISPFSGKHLFIQLCHFSDLIWSQVFLKKKFIPSFV